MYNTPSELASQIRDLKALVADLSVRVRQLELDRDQAAEFELVGPLPSRPSSTRMEGSQPACAAGSASSTASVAYPALTERESILVGIGHWVKQRVQGLGRGLSGRERLAQQSRIYLLFKDFGGQIYDPVPGGRSIGVQSC